MPQHVLKMLLLEEIEILSSQYKCQCGNCIGRYSRYPQVLPDDADSAYFDFYMPSYNKAYTASCSYAGDTPEPHQIARPPYHWDAEVGKWYPSGPIMHAPTDSGRVYTHTENIDSESTLMCVRAYCSLGSRNMCGENPEEDYEDYEDY